MKNIINFIRVLLCSWLLLVPLAMQSCTEDDGSLENITFSIEDSMTKVYFDSTTSSQSYTITGECNTSWSVDFLSSSASWLDFDTKKGSGNVEFTISTNEKYTDANQTRETVLVVEANGAKVLIYVYQVGVDGDGSVEQSSYTSVDQSGEEIVVVVDSNTSWTAVGADGVQVKGADGEPCDSRYFAMSDSEQEVTFIVPQNPFSADADYTVTIESEFFETIDIKITQNGYDSSTIALYDSANMNGEKFTTSSGNRDITVFGDCTNISTETFYVQIDEYSEWSIKTDGNYDWFNIIETKNDGTNDDPDITTLDEYFTINVTGDSAQERTAKITVVASNSVIEDVEIELTLKQTTDVVTLTVTEAVSVDSEGTTFDPDTFSVTSNNSTLWSIGSTSYQNNDMNEEWFSYSYAEDLKYTYEANEAVPFTFAADKNITRKVRTAQFTITALEGLTQTDKNTKTITITQAASDAKIWLTDSEDVTIEDNGELKVSGTENSTVAFKLVSNEDWTAAISGDNASKFSLSSYSGAALVESSIIVTASEENSSDDSIDATITITTTSTNTSTSTSFTISQIKAAIMSIATASDAFSAVSYYTGTIDLEVITNSDWKVEFRDNDSGTSSYSESAITWLSIDNNTLDADVKTATISVAHNDTGASRTGWILLVEPVSGEIRDSIAVTQGAYAASTLASHLLLFLQDLNDTNQDGQGGDAESKTPDNWGAEVPISEWAGITTASEYVEGDDAFYYITQTEIDEISDKENTIIALDLSGYGFSGHTPSANNTSVGSSLIQSTNGAALFANTVRVLDLSDNTDLYGTIANYYAFPALVKADFSDNKFNVINSAFITGAPKLQYLDLSNNSFQDSATGTAVSLSLATSMNGLTELVYVDIHNSNFGGALPTLADATKLEYFDASNNSFTGTISDAMSACSTLKVIKCNDNLLSGTISSTVQSNLIANFDMTTTTDVGAPIQLFNNTSLSGELSFAFQYWLKNLYEDGTTPLSHAFTYTDTTIETYITSQTAITLKVPALGFDDATDTQFASNIACSDGEYTIGITQSATAVEWKIAFSDSATSTDSAITWISAATTSFGSSDSSATINVEWNPSVASATRVGYILLLDSSDSIIDYVQVTQSPYSVMAASLMWILEELNNGASNPVKPTNWGSATEPISNWYGITTSSEYTGVSATDSDFTYSGEVGGEEVIYELDLSGLEFKGRLPYVGTTGGDALKKLLAELRVLDLSDNELTGIFANWYLFPSLQKLDISNNKIGTINPVCIPTMLGIKYIDLSTNSFGTSTSLTDSGVAALTTIEYFDIHNGGFGGARPDLSLSTSLSYYDISGNTITGTLPAGMATLPLTTLKCSGNAMSGTVDANYALNENYASWNAMENIFRQTADAEDDLVSYPNQASLYLDGLGAMRAFYKLTGGANSWDWSAYSADAISWLTSDYVFPTTSSATSYIGATCNTAGNVLWIGGSFAGSANKITGIVGSFPAELGMCTAAEYIQLAENSDLAGTIPLNLYANMRRINIKNCGISQPISAVFTTMRAMTVETKTASEFILSGNDFTGEFNTTLQGNVMAHLLSTGTAYDTMPIQLSGNANLEGELSAAFILWLKNVDSGDTSLGHSFTYTDQDIYDYILSGTKMTVESGSSYDVENVTTE